jgi:hypothetical protein
MGRGSQEFSSVVISRKELQQSYHPPLDHAAGKDAHQDEAKVERLAEGISKAVAEIPTAEEVLIILRKQEDPSHPSLQHRVVTKVNDAGLDTSRLNFLMWETYGNE